MGQRLIIDGNAVYEIDEECEKCKGNEKECREINQNRKDIKDKEKKPQ